MFSNRAYFRLEFDKKGISSNTAYIFFLHLLVTLAWMSFAVLFYVDLALLPLDVWDILVAKQPSLEVWHIAVQSGLYPDLKGDKYDHGIL
jgi:hypothetical protein